MCVCVSVCEIYTFVYGVTYKVQCIHKYKVLYTFIKKTNKKGKRISPTSDPEPFLP